MDSEPTNWLKKTAKRPGEWFNPERSAKRSRPREDRNPESSEKRFRVLLPNGTIVDLKIRHIGGIMPIQVFTDLLKLKCPAVLTEQRRIEWKSGDLHFVDAFENKIRSELDLTKYKPNDCHFLRLKDGSSEADTYENMWDLTPDTDLLKELPEEYTFETALADLIDNSLQAVWLNEKKERKLIRVKVSENSIEIFDTGPGMDGSPENSIVKWGKMGASLHRLAREKSIGTKPPYLTPYFGMFGYGGPIATMHLGRRAVVSSKTKKSEKVYKLHLEREALLNSNPEKTWRTKGGLRDPMRGELSEAPHGSFTKVTIFEPRLGGVNLEKLQCKLKDIYFPYIQCDELSRRGRTEKPVEFQVNGIDLAEVLSGEVALTNIHSCNGPSFVVQLRFTKETSQNVSSSSAASRASGEANACLKCVYFPIIEGKESIDSILEKLEQDGCGITENFKSFSRVSVRRLGRLLPDARWAWLPFMEPKQKKGVKGQILKRCCYRVKCFIDTDGGFNPTTSKTDLAHQSPFTLGLKSFGKKDLGKEKDVRIEIIHDGKEISLSKLEKLYEDWISNMHDQFDEEMATGNDEAVLIVDPPNNKDLGISSEVIRVHKLFWRKEVLWRSGQKIKILKGAYAGFHRTDTYATLEYIILEGWQGDAGCEARLICRPIDVPDKDGCVITDVKDNPTIRLGSSISLPVSVIDCDKFVPIEDAAWDNQIQKRNQKMPSSIEILGARDCHELGFRGALPDDVIDAGCDPSEEIVAVIRPAFFNSTPSKNGDRMQIVQEKHRMMIEIRYVAENSGADYVKVFSGEMTPSSLKGVHGFYIFKLRKEFPKLFERAGVYTFFLSLKDKKNVHCERSINVKALLKVKSWRLLGDKESTNFTARAGSCFPPFSIACFDKYDNRLRFPANLNVKMKVMSSYKGFTALLSNKEEFISSDELTLTIKDVQVESCDLDKIRPSYRVTLFIFPPDELPSVIIPSQVFPGVPRRVLFDSAKFIKQLIPGEIIKDLVLEVFDGYDNHVKENESIRLQVDGFYINDERGLTFKANQSGSVDLCDLFQVARGFGESVSFSVISDHQTIFKEVFQIERRELRAAFGMPIRIAAGSHLNNLIFEVVKMDGEVDRDIHGGHHHSLTIRSESIDLDESLTYDFHLGRCTVQKIPLPQKEGKFNIKATHSNHPELHLNVEVHILNQLHERKDGPSQTEGNILSHSFFDKRLQSSDKGLLLLPAPSTPSVIGNLKKCMTNDHKLENVPPHGSEGHRLSFKESSGLGHYNDALHTPAERSIMCLPDSTFPSHVESLATDNVLEDEPLEQLSLQELEDQILQYGSCIKEHEVKIEFLILQQSKIEEDISHLKGSLDLDERHDIDCTYEKELVMERIVSKVDTAAAVLCQLFQSSSEETDCDLPNDVIGVVACLGSVCSNDISRILARYLGEDQMLGIVCKSYAEASRFEKHESDGTVNNACGLHALAAKLGMSINKQYLVFCLENIRPYTGEVSTDSERKLLLPAPIMPNGNPPPGFLDYAVNMINLDVHYQRWMTPSGYGLRETLFYCLFGELQVYENRKYMNWANSCIKDGAVSLDGGILKGNGVLSLGYGDVAIQFPVVPSECNMQLSHRMVEIRKQMEGKEEELREAHDQLTREQKAREEVLKKFRVRKERYENVLDNIERSSSAMLCKIQFE
ncbi:OLC1v1027852C1 [Oldenlandia corymbosa var. corymbosa]|uniref:OLC1v1027852C1 n=1 Tax=Oldenlandia corymbosa var. corymbosa TaxID=529605 RepID=A0AAV1CAD7_OLDCO|nr:OLC1v1027852C1 [Oldenlandia corymbosa var. corymbosa]